VHCLRRLEWPTVDEQRSRDLDRRAGFDDRLYLELFRGRRFCRCEYDSNGNAGSTGTDRDTDGDAGEYCQWGHVDADLEQYWCDYVHRFRRLERLTVDEQPSRDLDRRADIDDRLYPELFRGRRLCRCKYNSSSNAGSSGTDRDTDGEAGQDGEWGHVDADLEQY
jgi:hypothetical protein